MSKMYAVIAAIDVQPGDLPEWYLVFADGWNELEHETKYLVDEQAWRQVSAAISRRGLEIVFDFEHQSLLCSVAPAAGWAREWRYVPGVGIEARIEWTPVAAEYIAKKEYRYYSPVFFVSKGDLRLIAIHSVALTNTPKTNNLKPLLAKLGAQMEEDDMLKKLIAKLALGENATEEEVIAAVAKLQNRERNGKVPAKLIAAKLGLGENATEAEVIAAVAKLQDGKGAADVPAEVIAALGAKAGDDVRTIVAGIHALKQTSKTMVSRDDFEALKLRMAARDADEIVAKALADGKITPDQREWAGDYAKRDLDGFGIFLAKAPIVVPMSKLPGRKQEADDEAIDAATLAVAKMMDIDQEDIKKYGGLQ